MILGQGRRTVDVNTRVMPGGAGRDGDVYVLVEKTTPGVAFSTSLGHASMVERKVSGVSGAVWKLGVGPSVALGV